MKIKINGNLKLKYTPSNFKPVAPKEKILLMSGIYDKYVLLEDTSLLWEAWDTPEAKMHYSCRLEYENKNCKQYKCIYTCRFSGLT